MRDYTSMLILLAVIAGSLGFFAFAGMAATIAKALFFLFLALTLAFVPRPR